MSETALEFYAFMFAFCVTVVALEAYRRRRQIKRNRRWPRQPMREIGFQSNPQASDAEGLLSAPRPPPKVTRREYCS